MKNRLALTCFAALGAQWVATPAHAFDCASARGYVGLEGDDALSRDSLWGSDSSPSNFTVNGYASGTISCQLSEQISVKASGAAQYAMDTEDPGTLDGKKDSGVAILNEGYVTWKPSEQIFLDVGKIERNNGNLFSQNPLDVVRNTSGNLRSTLVSNGDTNRYGFYREGSVGVGVSAYNDHGTIDLAYLPKLASNSDQAQSAERWSTLERTNSNNRFYAAFTSSVLSNFNPTVAAVVGDYNVLGVGTSGYLMDNLMLGVQASVSKGQRWRHLDMAKAEAIRAYQNVGDPFAIDRDGALTDIAVGLRYTDSERREYGIEYYGQSQGYSRNEWKGYFDTVTFINGGYAKGLPSAVASNLASGYDQYSSLFASETDNANRANNLLGKHYLTVFVSSKKQALRKLDWTASVTTNLVDGSAYANARLSTFASNHVELYTGASMSFGSSRSEFGQFGRRGYVYAGTRIIV
ncbi:lysozyme inhibitor LprI family protein [Paraburkholderia oxyphila]|uniref:hypothetical protein n=1 Tax=Paraburkholderia oxyphila TaxID=614212 RepID=UPI00047F090F|nr:hypothetical protein [Paraburkholderia oxyphila]